MPDPNLTIGTMSAQTRCSVPTIRYYEKIGLLPSPDRASNGHRYYREVDLKRLTFIKRCRDFGFPIEQVRELTDLFEDGDRACVEVRDLAKVHLDEVRAKLAEMRELEASLAAFVCSCDTACSGGRTKDCVIIDDLATPASSIASAGVSCCVVPAAPSSALITKELKRK
ncbi:MerR family transcriptional regulator [Rugamonas aquatica]|uniref:MerR family transcriptional regulator n=1 Tax=Rugamonas aquatica TaxID=2743357 RepID=A0A6A7MWL2_9BURK|nr:helix-turn-helix domain-containing protein [Rugamonas aquatica]MQA37068.1 MerR family transcriptional regulator [Rugamonas aquatica]